MNPLDIIQYRYESFTKKERQIADFILKEPRQFIRMTPDWLAENIKVSKASLIRFSKKLGYSGYSEYISELTKFLIKNNASTENDKDFILTIGDLYSSIIQETAVSLNRTLLETCAKDILAANRAFVYGFNRTGLSAKQLSYRSLSMGVSITAVTDDSILMNDYARTLSAKDLVIFLTTNDNTKYFRKNIKLFKESGCTIIAVTANDQLPFLGECDYTFLFPTGLRKYGTFNDEQILYYLFTELLIYQLSVQTGALPETMS